MFRSLSILAVAVALLLSPLTMATGAIANVGHGPASELAGGQCPDGDSPAGQEHPGSMTDCAVACAAIPTAQPPVRERIKPTPTVPALASHPVLAGISPEGEKPPPRITLEI